MGRFIADFYCAQCRLVIELDGSVHDDRSIEDTDRSRIIESHGCKVIRFTNERVFEDLDSVLAEILTIARSGQNPPK